MGAGIFSVLWLASLLSLSSTWNGWAGVLAQEDGGVTSSSSAAASETPPPSPPLLTVIELEELVERLRGDDHRIVRWDATRNSRRAQRDGACDALPRALDSIVRLHDDSLSAAAAAESGKETEDKSRLLTLACEYLTFCITDNPVQRARLSEYRAEGGGPNSSAVLYKAVVSLVGHADPAVSAGASHVVYIATFANKANHWGFHRAGAVAALSDVIIRFQVSLPPAEVWDTAEAATATGNASSAAASTTSSSLQAVRPDQAMWAAAALQNMVASYCATNGDGRCYWHWTFVEGGLAHELQISGSSLPVVSEGTSMRLTALQQRPELVSHLAKLVCQHGPVIGPPTDNNPHPGVNAKIGYHETSPSLVAWAAAGAIKNLALDPEGRQQVQSVQKWFLPCLCRLSHSPDWLEENKGGGALEHVRFGDPCWFDDEGDAEKEEEGGNRAPPELLCIDDNFRDEGGYHCGDYVHPSDTDCDASDVLRPNLLARQACCSCGGGMRLKELQRLRDQEL